MSEMVPPATPAAERPCMVLLVDDQAIVGESVRRMLAESSAINFHYCADPTAAIASAERVQPTVILQDLIMPAVDGLDLVAQYRRHPRLRHVPVIVLSVKEDPRVKSEAFAIGASDYLVKLPDAIELVARIRLHSNAYRDRMERDGAYRALRESQRQLLDTNMTLVALNQELQGALSKVKRLTGLIPICSYCKRIRSDEDFWEQVEQYITEHSEAEFTHGVCPPCLEAVLNDFRTP